MKLSQGVRINVGALGEVYFEEGFYAYTGSALGKQGYSRIRRHLDVASGRNATRQWHIDYLLPNVEVIETVRSPRPECSVAGDVDKALARIPGFGCSDCRCKSHLHYADSIDTMKKAVFSAHRQ